jgi:CheY-like chemotaxis protein
MKELAAPRHIGAHECEPPIRLLVADGDRLARSLLSSCARDAVEEIVVLEAEDGAQAIRVGLQQRPAIALLDINMPRLGGIEAAITLRDLQPRMRLALRSADPLTHRKRARAHQLPLFSKLELDHTLAWLRAQIDWYTETQSEAATPRKLNLRCTCCGYGIFRSTPPERCPMCQAENAWIYAPSRASTTVLTR